MDGKTCSNWDTLSFITECEDDGAGGNKTMCAKIEQFTEGRKRVIRKCSTADTEPGCIRRIASDNMPIRHCHCREPLCNPASHPTLSPSLIASTLICLLGASLWM
ncbi:unnamed protein product [Mesocestoides corti]|nr:unnamed protein product [Mesocestoides corti]